MENRERLARILCERHDINPDAKGYGLGRHEPVGSEYFLWGYWARYYVDPLLEALYEDE